MPESLIAEPNEPAVDKASRVDALPEDAVRIVSGDRLGHGDQRAAVDVLYQGFRRKLHSLLLLSDSQQQIKRILPEVLDFSQSLVAVCETAGTVCGVLLMNLGGKDYLNFDWKLARREYGLWGSVYRRVNYWIVNGKRRDNYELSIQALAVRRGMRCRGVGTKLIDAAGTFAMQGGFDHLSLEVVDSNPRAKRLCERIGFALEQTNHTWPYTARAGFRGYDYMIKRLPATRPAADVGA